MPSSRRKAVFSLEDAREAVMNSDSENEFDNMSIDLDSEEDYSDVDDEGNHHVQPSEFDEFSDPEYDAPSSPNGPADLGSGVGGDGGEATGEETAADQPASAADQAHVRGATGNKRRRVVAPTPARSWGDDPSMDPDDFMFTGEPGVNPDTGLSATSTPLDCYLQFVSKETFEGVAAESNRYTGSYLRENPPSPSSPANKWTRTSAGVYFIYFHFFFTSANLQPSPACHQPTRLQLHLRHPHFFFPDTQYIHNNIATH